MLGAVGKKKGVYLKNVNPQRSRYSPSAEKRGPGDARGSETCRGGIKNERENTQ